MKIEGSEEVYYPEMNPSGVRHIAKKVETYRNIPADAKISINPGFYSFTDNSRNITVDLNQP